MNDLGALVGHVADFGVAHIGQRLRVLHNTGIGGQYAVDVGVNVNHICPESCAQRRSGGVASAPSESREVAFFRLPLKAGDDDDLLAAQLALYPFGPHIENPGIAVAVIRKKPCLGSGEHRGRDAFAYKKTAQRRCRYDFTAAQQ
ncbi:hypothetical protein D3C71_1383600 [compost metagenome]